MVQYVMRRRVTIEILVSNLRFDPAMLSNWVVYGVFVVPVAHGITAHVCAELERIITILRTGPGFAQKGWIHIEKSVSSRCNISTG
jgi:formate hydrogenlyase subunit 4